MANYPFLFDNRQNKEFVLVYELFYHGGSKGWISLGCKVAATTCLEYDNVPANALLHLRNRTQGGGGAHILYENWEQEFISELGETV